MHIDLGSNPLTLTFLRGVFWWRFWVQISKNDPIFAKSEFTSFEENFKNVRENVRSSYSLKWFFRQKGVFHFSAIFSSMTSWEVPGTDHPTFSFTKIFRTNKYGDFSFFDDVIIRLWRHNFRNFFMASKCSLTTYDHFSQSNPMSEMSLIVFCPKNSKKTRNIGIGRYQHLPTETNRW